MLHYIQCSNYFLTIIYTYLYVTHTWKLATKGIIVFTARIFPLCLCVTDMITVSMVTTAIDYVDYSASGVEYQFISLIVHICLGRC